MDEEMKETRWNRARGRWEYSGLQVNLSIHQKTLLVPICMI